MALAEAHGSAVKTQVEKAPLDPTKLTEAERHEMVASVLRFQETFAQKSTLKIDKYLKLIGQTRQEGQFGPPVCLVPPYFYDESVGGPKYKVSLELAHLAAGSTDAERVRPVACVLKSALSSTVAIEELVHDYGPFAQTILFPSKFEEAEASQPELQGFWGLVRGLAHRDRPPFMLYGGYFSILASRTGLDGLSHGIGYGESRDALSPRSGPPVKRFYIPALHRFFPIAEAQTLLRLDRSNRKVFRCTCASCEAARTAGRGPLDHRTREDIFLHFLQIRHGEIQDVQQRSLPELVAKLRDLHGYATSIAPGLTEQLNYLERWASAIEAAEGI